MAPRRVVVFGPTAQACVVIALLAAAVAFAWLGHTYESGLLVVAIVSRMLPVERGRPGDVVKLVTRGIAPPQRRGPPPLPLQPPRDDD